MKDDAMKPGDNITCRVIEPEGDGYSVTLMKDDMPGLILSSPAPLSAGDEVSSRFLCLRNGRALLAMRCSRGPSMPVSPSDESEDITESSRAQRLHLRRASDLIPPAFTPEHEKRFDLTKSSFRDLIKNLEDSKQTGCLKTSSSEWLSRAVLLLYQGRVVGSIYSCKGMARSQPVVDSLRLTLADLDCPSTDVTVYDLPASVILPLSALFFGSRVQRTERKEPKAYFKQIADWCKAKSVTGCCVITLPLTTTTCLVFIHEGDLIGVHHVERQIYTRDRAYAEELLTNDPAADLALTVLPKELLDWSEPFGVSLASAIDEATK